MFAKKNLGFILEKAQPSFRLLPAPHFISSAERPILSQCHIDSTPQRQSGIACTKMPLKMASDAPQIPSLSPSYPAITKQVASTIDGIDTDVTSTAFSDKIMITITQGGRLAQWVQL